MNYINKAFIIAGTRSGCGKTTMTMGILGALAAKGYDVQPWKTGPDYIDPGFLGAAAGKVCRNLDTMILEEAIVKELFFSRSSDVAVVEGVMGLFDGAGPLDERGSAAHLSKILGLPVFLVLDGKAVGRSAAATALGFLEFDREVNLAGFLINRVGSEHHYELLKTAIEEKTGKPVLGYLKREDCFILPERHLGLDQDINSSDQKKIRDSIVESVSRTVDLEGLLSLAGRAVAEEGNTSQIFSETSRREPFVRIAVARDEAFRFYYEDNLDILRHRGAEIRFFSPLSDCQIEEEVDALYLGGGYPELYGEKLSANRSLLQQLRQLAEGGIPVYGECGGFMYLTEEIIDGEGRSFPMAGLLPGKARLGEKLRSLGYCESELKADSILGQKGTRGKGHVFHWSALEGADPGQPRILTIRKGPRELEEGFCRGNVLGSWVHHHFASNPAMAESLIAAAERYRREKYD